MKLPGGRRIPSWWGKENSEAKTEELVKAMCAQAGETGSLRTTATEQGPPTPNCTGLHKALRRWYARKKGPKDSRETATVRQVVPPTSVRHSPFEIRGKEENKRNERNAANILSTQAFFLF